MSWPDVTAADIEGRWRDLDTDERAVAGKRIGDAKAELNRELRLRGVTGTPTLPTSEETDEWELLYTATIVEAVRRYLANPEGWLEEREAIDDADFTRRRDKSMSGGLVWIDPADVDSLIPRPRPKRGAFTIALGQS